MGRVQTRTMVDGNANFDRNNSHDVNVTVDGDEDRGATEAALDSPVSQHQDLTERGKADEYEPADKPAPSHDYEGSTKGARTDDQYESQVDKP